MKWTLHRIAAAIVLTTIALSTQPAAAIGREGHADPARIHVPEAGQRARAEEVRIASEPGVTLAGTLRTPRGPGPYPVCCSWRVPDRTSGALSICWSTGWSIKASRRLTMTSGAQGARPVCMSTISH